VDFEAATEVDEGVAADKGPPAFDPDQKVV
jgi:hypothetical protein